MTEKPSTRRRAAQQPPDFFALWFFRILQIIGTVIVLNEIIVREVLLHREDIRIVAVGTGLAMATGAAGIERLIQWFTAR